MNDVKLWLDLEETIIESWDNPVLLVKNRDAIRKFIVTNKVESVNIFSFAIWNDKDKTVFSDTLKLWLEDSLGVKIAEFPSVEEMAKEIFWKNGTVFTVSEFCAIWGKEKAFIDYIRVSQGPGKFVLIDDVVEMVIMNRMNKEQEIHTLNVNDVLHFMSKYQ